MKKCPKCEYVHESSFVANCPSCHTKMLLVRPEGPEELADGLRRFIDGDAPDHIIETILEYCRDEKLLTKEGEAMAYAYWEKYVRR